MEELKGVNQSIDERIREKTENYRNILRIVVILLVVGHLVYFLQDAKSDINDMRTLYSTVDSPEYQGGDSIAKQAENIERMENYEDPKTSAHKELSVVMWSFFWNLIVSMLLLMLLGVIWIENRLENFGENVTKHIKEERDSSSSNDT